MNASFSAAHTLRGYGGACERLHGHTFGVEVVVTTDGLDETDMGTDLVELEAMVHGETRPLDHVNLNELPYFAEVNPTAERLARLIYRRVSARLGEGVKMRSVTVDEGGRFSATYFE